MKPKPLTDRMWQVLKLLAKSSLMFRPQTPNEIARSLGYIDGQDKGHHAHDGRAMAPAQRVIFPLIGLRERGLVRMTPRRDKLSGTAYQITDAGRAYVKEFG